MQWAHDPRVDGALGDLPGDSDGAIVRICRRVRDLLPPPPDLGTRSVSSPSAPPSGGLAALVPGDTPGRLDGVPPLPLGYVHRDELDQLRSALLAGGDGAVGITGDVHALGLHGQGGIGKSVLAAALACDPQVARCFPDGIFWVSLGERADVVAAQIDLLNRLGIDESEVRTVTQGVKALREALVNRSCLVVVDDVWTDAAARAFRVTGRRSRVLYTTRDPLVLKAAGARIEAVEVLPEAAARQLLAQLAETTVEELPAQVDDVLTCTGRVALALALVGAAVGRGGKSWAEVVTELTSGAETFLDHPYANTFASMRVGLSALTDAQAERYQALAVYPEDTPVPVASVARLWRHRFGVAPTETAAELAMLAERRLVTVADETIGFHDLQREFLLLHTVDVVLLHAQLLDAYRALLPADTPYWSALPPDEPYIWDHLIFHLRGAGCRSELVTVVADAAHLTRRIAGGGSYAAESDLRQVIALQPGDERLDWLLRQVERWSHLLRATESVAELAATLASRITDDSGRSS